MIEARVIQKWQVHLTRHLELKPCLLKFAKALGRDVAGRE